MFSTFCSPFLPNQLKKNSSSLTRRRGSAMSKFTEPPRNCSATFSRSNSLSRTLLPPLRKGSAIRAPWMFSNKCSCLFFPKNGFFTKSGNSIENPRKSYHLPQLEQNRFGQSDNAMCCSDPSIFVFSCWSSSELPEFIHSQGRRGDGYHVPPCGA